MNRMLGEGIRHLPVMDQGALVGIVSVRDVVRQGLAEIVAVRDALERYIHEASIRALDDD